MSIISKYYGKMWNPSYGELYIHHNSKNIGEIETPNIQNVYEGRAAAYKKMIAKNFNYSSNEYKDIFALLDEVQLNLQSDIIMNEINKTTATARDIKIDFDNERTQSVSSLKWATQNTSITNNINNLQKYISTLDKVINEIPVMFDDIIINDIAKEIIINKEGNEHYSEIMSNIISQKMKKYQGKILQRGDKSSLTSFEKYAIRLKTYIQVLQNIAATGNIKNENSKYLIQRSAYFIADLANQIAGFLQEQLVNDMIIASNNSVLKSIQSAVVGSESSQVIKGSISAENYKQLSKKIVTKTSDINLTYSASDDNGHGNISIALPGISVKKVGESEKGKTDVHIKTGANLVDTLIRSKNFQNKYHYAFINLVSSYGGTAKKELKQIKQFIAAKNIINALAGTGSKDDLAYFIIINDKVFTISDIINMLGQNNSMINIAMNLTDPKEGNISTFAKNLFLTESRFSKEENAALRSHKIYQYLHNANVNFTLMINNKLLFD